LHAQEQRFLSCADGLALVAHLCNAAAKFICSSFYEMKGELVEAAANAHPFAWHRDGVVYIETCVGQVSFHVFEDCDLDLIPERDTPWAGGWMQDRAREMALAFLNDELDPEFERWIRKVQAVEGGPRTSGSL
jgi:hypothetical protein